MARNSSIRIRPASDSAWAHHPRPGAIRVLVVHSSWVWCHAYTHHLEAEGFVAYGAPGPIGTTARVLHDAIDVVVLEKGLPGVRLTSLISLVRRARPNVAVVLLSRDVDEDATMLPGVDAVTPEKGNLASAIRDALDRRSPLTLGLGS